MTVWCCVCVCVDLRNRGTYLLGKLRLLYFFRPWPFWYSPFLFTVPELIVSVIALKANRCIPFRERDSHEHNPSKLGFGSEATLFLSRSVNLANSAVSKSRCLKDAFSVKDLFSLQVSNRENGWQSFVREYLALESKEWRLHKAEVPL